MRSHALRGKKEVAKIRTIFVARIKMKSCDNSQPLQGLDDAQLLPARRK